MSPPAVGPSVGASTDTIPRIAGTMVRSFSENRLKPTEKTVGIIAPPVKPCIALNTIMDSIFHAKPQATLDRVNNAADEANSRRVDMACARKPEKGTITISAIPPILLKTFA